MGHVSFKSTQPVPGMRWLLLCNLLFQDAWPLPLRIHPDPFSAAEQIASCCCLPDLKLLQSEPPVCQYGRFDFPLLAGAGFLFSPLPIETDFKYTCESSGPGIVFRAHGGGFRRPAVECEGHSVPATPTRTSASHRRQVRHPAASRLPCSVRLARKRAVLTRPPGRGGNEAAVDAGKMLREFQRASGRS